MSQTDKVDLMVKWSTDSYKIPCWYVCEI